jgi:hypothetical protein
MQFIVNKTGTVHSIPDEWLAEKLASGYRAATQDEIDAHYKAQGLKDVPKVAELERDYEKYLGSIDEASLAQATTIGPRPGDVDVRLTKPGDPGFVVGNDGMREVPSHINPVTSGGSPAGAGQGVGEQDAHAYEVIVPEVAEAAIHAVRLRSTRSSRQRSRPSRAVRSRPRRRRALRGQPRRTHRPIPSLIRQAAIVQPRRTHRAARRMLLASPVRESNPSSVGSMQARGPV